MADGARKPTRMTLREFLAWEEAQPLKYEFLGGLVRAMASGSQAHNTVKLNIASALKGKLRGRQCRAFDSDMKVILADGQSVYPDVTVDCGAPDPRSATATTPTIVFEALSPSTRESDFAEKLPAYQATPTIRQIVFAEVARMHLYVWTRDEAGAWVETEVARPDDALDLPAAGVSLGLLEVYEDVGMG